MNEDALFRQPITLEDYLSSRWVSKPVRVLDCDYPCDMSGAVIFTTEERARNWKKKPVFVESTAMACVAPSWEQLDDLFDDAIVPCSKQLWAGTDLKPKDVDVVELYDGFSIIAFPLAGGLRILQTG